MSSIIEGVILGLSVAAPIGPTNIEMIRRGLQGGFWVCFSFAAGVEVALITYLAVIFAGLSFLTEIELFNVVISALGILVLFYMGIVNINDFFKPRDLDINNQSRDNKHFVPGILLTITNPAVLLFFSGIIGASIAAKEFTFVDGLLISSCILIGVSIWFLGLSTLVSAGRRYITPKVFAFISLIAGLVLLGFGLSFGYKILQKFV